jgi:hypothetical protein
VRRAAAAARERPRGRGRLLEWGKRVRGRAIFLGAGFVHILPDANAAWRQLGWHYPIACCSRRAAIVFMLLSSTCCPPEDCAPRDARALGQPVRRRTDNPARIAARGVRDPHRALVHSLLEGSPLGRPARAAQRARDLRGDPRPQVDGGFALGVSLARGAAPAARTRAARAVRERDAGRDRRGRDGRRARGPRAADVRGDFLSLAAGTFAYVATLDILREEFHEPGGRFAKWLWVVAGAAVMALLALWV